LEEAINSALQSHPTVNQQKEKTYELRFKIDESWIDFFPHLAASTSYTDFENENFRNWNVKLRYPLFEGGRVVYEYRKNEALSKTAEAYVEIVEQKLILNVKLAFVNLLLEKKLLEAAHNEKNNFSKLFSIAESLFSAGKIPRSDLIRIKAKLLESEGVIIEEERKRDVAQSVLLLLLSRDQREEIEVEPLITHVIDESMSLDESLELARALRPEWREFHEKERGLESELGLAKSDYWPRIYIDGQYGGSNNPLDHMGMRNSFDGLDEFWSVGVNIEVDFWNWGKAKTRVRQAESQRRQLGFERNGFLNDLSFEVKDAYLAWRAAQKNLINVKELLDSSSQAYELILEDYQTGKATNEAILETINYLIQSQKAYEEAFFASYTAEFKLEQILGVIR